ncbi:MAG: hypothetical protein ABW156_12330, partial [Jiangellaceae bacterium]
MDINSLTRPADTRAAVNALFEAASTAGYAPSIHNNQPWRWRLTGKTLDLHLVRSRIPPTSDPDGRLATLSCGAALHHARIRMAAQGWHLTVTRMLRDADRDLLARLHVQHRSPVDPNSAMLVDAMASRYSEPRTVADRPLDPDALTAITAAIEAQGTRQHTLRPDQLFELAAADSHAQRSQAADPAWQAELIYRTGRAGLAQPGIPDAGPDRTTATATAICRSPRDRTRPRFPSCSTAAPTNHSTGCAPAKHSLRAGSPPPATASPSFPTAPPSRPS